ncbi:acyltransferase family protein [Acetobacter fabarum]
MRYRSDIDGLRALAILPVVFFHYGLKHPFNGGFAGVDIFFVISGFLITRHIHDAVEQDQFNILDFYHRRIRRILPALFSVLFVCFGVSTLTQTPPEVYNTSRGILWSILFASNIFFYSQSSYFDSSLQANPLLHTWSLSVEEQFYIVIPFLIYFSKKFFKIPLKYMVFSLLVLSFSACFVEIFQDKPATFYLPQYRAWEFLVGSAVMLATQPAVMARSRMTKPVMESFGAIGIIFILVSLVALNNKSLFPGPGALGPCLGAALVLYSGSWHRTVVASGLSCRPLRFIGLVSYSLYLWHWPIWVFFSMYDRPNAWTIPLLLGAAFGVSALSWRFIEQPFRTRPFRLSAKSTIGVMGGIMVVTVLLAFASSRLNAILWHYSPAEQKVMSYMAYKPATMRTGTCFIDRKTEDIEAYKAAHCLDVQAGKKNYLVLGDSHAADRWYGLQQSYPDINFLQATAPSCEPVLGKNGGQCGALLHYIFEVFLPSHHLDGVILSANWLEHDFNGIVKTAQMLGQYTDRVIVLGPSPEYDQPLPLLLVRAMVKNNMALVFNHILQDRKKRDQNLAIRLKGTGIEYVSVYNILCPDTVCLTTVNNNVPVLFDADHFTAEGSVFLAGNMHLFDQTHSNAGRFLPH